MSEYTKEPWHVHDAREKEILNGDWYVVDGEGMEIATVNGENCREREANARLIASAPDMLDLLKLVIESGALSYHYEDIRTKVVSLISKAEGE